MKISTHKDQSVTVTSSIDNSFSAVIFPLPQFNGGNGFHYTKGGMLVTPAHVPAEVKDEMEAEVKKIWKEGYQHA